MVATVSTDVLTQKPRDRRLLAAAVLVLLWAWVAASILTSTLIVQDECHFFDPVYEMVDHGKWRGPHNEYMGHGIENLQYGHPAANGLLQAPWLILTGSGWWAVRISALLQRTVAIACVLVWMYRGLLSPAAAVASSLLFLFFSYITQSVVRPDLLAGLCLLGMLWQLRAGQTVRQTAGMAVFWALAGLFHQFAIIAGGAAWAAAVAAALYQKQYAQAGRLIVGSVAAGLLFTALFILPVAVLHGPSAVPDLFSGTVYHLKLISYTPPAAEIARRTLTMIPQFTLLLLMVPWILAPRSGMNFTERCMAIAYACGYGYLAVATNFTTWYFVILAPLGAYLFGRSLTLWLPQWTKVVRIGCGVAIAALAVVCCRHGLVGTAYGNLANGASMDRLLRSLVEEYIPPDTKVLTAPQFYHYLKRRCAMTRDLENFARFTDGDDFSPFDYVLCMDEQEQDDALRRFNKEQRTALRQQCDLIYDSDAQHVEWLSNHMRSLGRKVPVPQILIFARKHAEDAAGSQKADGTNRQSDSE